MLSQLSYAPRLRGGLDRRLPGITRGVSRPGNDNPETNRQAEDDLLQEEAETGSEGDAGGRDDALADEDEQ